MRVCVTEHRDLLPSDLRPTGELAPSLALPWIAKLRDGVLMGQVLLVLLAHYFFHIELPVGWIAIPLSVSAVSNVLLHCFMKPFSARSALGLLLAFDTICLTALLALTGGPANPFSVLYLVEITLSAVVLSKSWTWTLGGLSTVGFGLLFWVHERLASIATLAAGAAHELGTPLATIAVASRDFELNGNGSSGRADIADDARLIRSQVERCSQILRQMGGRSAEPAGEMPNLISLREICAQVKSELPCEQRDRVDTRVEQDATTLLPTAAARQVLSALVKNALESSAPGQRVMLAAQFEPGKIRFTVQDAGCGMSPETLNRIAEPFYTTKGTGGGLGLGTFLARLFAERLNGSLAFESEVGIGTEAILELPLIHHDGKG